MEGFLGTGAPLSADLNLTFQLLMGTALLIGMFLARRKRFRAHGICQSTVMLLNLVVIFWLMLPSFRDSVIPGLPEQLNRSYYAVAMLHAGAGAIAELLGLYIILRAGTNLLPRSLSFENYKLWMRTELALWWLVVLLGVATYYVWL